MQTKQLTVLNKLGLHARPCALLAKTAGFFKSSITLTHNNHSVDAKSILGLMTMAANTSSASSLIFFKISEERLGFNIYSRAPNRTACCA